MSQAKQPNPFARRKIVIVDDHEENTFLLSNMLKSNGFQHIITFNDSIKALEAIKNMERAPDMFILDIMMPNMDGIELCRNIRTLEKLNSAAIIFVTARDDDEILQKAYETGGQDFIGKPFSKIELSCRLKSLFTVQEFNRNLEAKNEKLQHTAITDGLTGLFNRTYLDQRLEEAFHKSKRYNHDLTFMILDIDHFKRINDTYGHPSGDEVLKELATLVNRMIRNSDIFARYGGEEFAIIFGDINMESALLTAERIRETVESHKFPEVGNHRVTISCGLSSFATEIENSDELVKNADKALYEAKNSGRNRVCKYSK